MRFLSIIFCSFLLVQSAFGQDYDTVIRNCRVVDGTGKPWFRADVGIRDGIIEAVGRLPDPQARLVIDAQDRFLTPGFIDIHTHIERGIQRNPAADNFLFDGVTGVVTGNCGGSQIDLGSWLRALEEEGLSLKVASLIGHNSVRRSVMGNADRPATPDQLRAMGQLVEQAMKAGAVGLSTGLLYVPGTYANTDEIVSLARVVARYRGVYATHIRNQGPRLRQSILEAAEIGKQAGLRVQISHLKVKGKKRWGSIGQILQLLEQLRDEGLEIAADAYPYPRASTSLSVNLPSWSLADTPEAVAQRLADPETRRRIKQGMRELLAEQGFSDYSFARVAGFPADPSMEGKTISEINRLRGRDAGAAAEMETILEMLDKGGASMIYHYMSDEDVDSILRFPHTVVASDGGVQSPGRGRPHPRSYGTNARILARYVRDRALLGLEDAVRRMTSLPAQRMGFQDRGLVRKGQVADLVLFDLGKVRDQATFEQPHRLSEGFDYVWVNGVAVIVQGARTEARPGRILRPAQPQPHD